MVWTSTLPGPMYATPRFSGMTVLPPESERSCGRVELLDGFRAGGGHGVVGLDRRAREADRDGDRVAVLDRDAARERDQPAVGVLDVVEGAARLGEAADVSGVHVEPARSPRLLLRDVDAAEPRAVHARERLEVGARVDDGDVHRRADLLGLLDRRLQRSVRLVEAEVLGTE